MTSIERLKAYGARPLQGTPSLESNLAEWYRDKEFSPVAVNELAESGVLGPIVRDYLMGRAQNNRTETRYVLNFLGRNARVSETLEVYRGTRNQNAKIDSALSRALHLPTDTRFLAGACTYFRYSDEDIYSQLPSDVRSVPIAIIGNGAAGIMVRYALEGHGFNNIVSYEKAKALGIWSRESVYTRSRNNPANLKFQSYNLPAAPGPGNNVKGFLENLVSYSSISQNVESVAPGVLSHMVSVNKEFKTFPIVINCAGLGSPRAPHDPKRMKTSTRATQCGERWQRVLSLADVKGKMFVFIGLGNSTAEMLRQIHEWQDKGVECDYRILTHYPYSCLNDPNTDVRGKRIFRDTSKPNLTSFQGDLPDSRYDYYRALYGAKIIGGVTRWERSGNTITYTQNYGQGYQPVRSVYFDHLFTLIGYQQTVENFKLYGVPTDPKDKCALLDYDGEVQMTNDASGRLHKGYFVFGAAAQNPQDKNAIVIPGMLFRLHDLLPSIIMRATEYVTK